MLANCIVQHRPLCPCPRFPPPVISFLAPLLTPTTLGEEQEGERCWHVAFQPSPRFIPSPPPNHHRDFKCCVCMWIFPCPLDEALQVSETAGFLTPTAGQQKTGVQGGKEEVCVVDKIRRHEGHAFFFFFNYTKLCPFWHFFQRLSVPLKTRQHEDMLGAILQSGSTWNGAISTYSSRSGDGPPAPNGVDTPYLNVDVSPHFQRFIFIKP